MNNKQQLEDMVKQKGGFMNKDVKKARKILDDNGIRWCNYFDLNRHLVNNNPLIVEAVKRVKQHLVTGR